MNAYTAADHTTYMLSVNNDAFGGVRSVTALAGSPRWFLTTLPIPCPGRPLLPPYTGSQALDRFAQFFHAPLFNPSCVEREMNAVDEEFRKNIGEDGWRILHVLKELADPAHPFTYFNTGNLESMKRISQARPRLARGSITRAALSYAPSPPHPRACPVSLPAMQDTLKEWYRTHYVAPAMRLVLYSRETPAWYTDTVVRLFGPVAAGPQPVTDAAELARVRESRKVTAPARLMRPEIDGQWIHVVPIKDLRELTLTWEIDPALCDRTSRAASLASHGTARIPLTCAREHTHTPARTYPLARSTCVHASTTDPRTPAPFPPSPRPLPALFPPPSRLRLLPAFVRFPPSSCSGPRPLPTFVVVGHEGDGSLYAHLHGQGLIESLSAGPSCSGAANWSFSISLQLTEAGLARRSEVVEQLFAALAAWERTPFPTHLRDESNTMAAVRYRFQSRGSVFDAVVRPISRRVCASTPASLANQRCRPHYQCTMPGPLQTRHARQLRDEPLETYPMQTVLLPPTSADHMGALWRALQPERCHITVVGPPELPADPAVPFRVERYMKASYRVWPFASAELARFRAARSGAAPSPVHYPQPNDFIPRNLHALPASRTLRCITFFRGAGY